MNGRNKPRTFGELRMGMSREEFEFNQHVARLFDALGGDPERALQLAKALVEALEKPRKWGVAAEATPPIRLVKS